MNDILSTILKDTYTLTQLRHRLNVLKSYLNQTFFGSAQKPEIEENNLWLKSLPPSFFQSFNKDNTTGLIAELEKQITNMQTLTVYLTFEADNASLTSIGLFVRKTFAKYLLLDIKIDPNLIAGAALVWKGIYKDYSLRAKIEQQKMVILESFKKYLR